MRGTSLMRMRSRYALGRPVVRLGLAAAALALAGLLYVGGRHWLPTYREAVRLEQAHTRSRTALRRAISAAAVQTAYDEALPRVERQEAKLAGHGGQAELMQALGGLAQRAGVRIVSQAYEPGRPHEGLATLEHELVLSGPYAGMRSFLAGLERLPSWTVVRRTEIAPSGDGPDALRTALQLATYRQPEPDEAP